MDQSNAIKGEIACGKDRVALARKEKTLHDDLGDKIRRLKNCSMPIVDYFVVEDNGIGNLYYLD